MRILFLCSELAGYFANSITALKANSETEILIICWPPTTVTPYQHSLEGIEVVNRETVRYKEIVQRCRTFDPDIVYVSGWTDKTYLRISRLFKSAGKITIGGIDTPWEGKVRQYLMRWISNIIIKPAFSHLWVAGYRQYLYAIKLGYSHQSILSGVYVADIDRFGVSDKQIFHKELLFVGRFEEEKGIEILIDVFTSLSSSERNGWTLRCIGNGKLREKIRSGPNVVVEDFLQPEDLALTTRNAGGFILPSIREPWGVVVQEFAAAGLPLILSSAVNAGEKYLIHNYNGFSFHSGDKAQLKQVLTRFFNLELSQIRLMGSRSHRLAFSYTTEHWVARLLSVRDNSDN